MHVCTYVSYGRNSVMDAKLGVSLFRWSRRFTWVLCPNCDGGNLGVLLRAAGSQQPLWE